MRTLKISICPICGCNKLRTVSGRMVFTTPEGQVVVPNVVRILCLDCGEQLFDHNANRILDGYRGKATARGLRKRISPYRISRTSATKTVHEARKKYGRRK